MKIKAQIKWIIDDDNKEGMWMIIDRGDTGAMWAIEEDEISAVYRACEDWMVGQDTREQLRSKL